MFKTWENICHGPNSGFNVLNIESTARSNSGAVDSQSRGTQQDLGRQPQGKLPGSILAFTDGGCDGNGANSNWGKAGWGAWIATKFLSNSDPVPLSDLWGPVITDKKSEFYQKCDLGSNNTGELTGILQALLWARQHGGHEPFALCYDSMYVANITSGLWKPKTNKGIASLSAVNTLSQSLNGAQEACT